MWKAGSAFWTMIKTNIFWHFCWNLINYQPRERNKSTVTCFTWYFSYCFMNYEKLLPELRIHNSSFVRFPAHFTSASWMVNSYCIMSYEAFPILITVIFILSTLRVAAFVNNLHSHVFKCFCFDILLKKSYSCNGQQTNQQTICCFIAGYICRFKYRKKQYVIMTIYQFIKNLRLYIVYACFTWFTIYNIPDIPVFTEILWINQWILEWATRLQPDRPLTGWSLDRKCQGKPMFIVVSFHMKITTLK